MSVTVTDIYYLVRKNLHSTEQAKMEEAALYKKKERQEFQSLNMEK